VVILKKFGVIVRTKEEVARRGKSYIWGLEIRGEGFTANKDP
jgi:hypothetical protein